MSATPRTGGGWARDLVAVLGLVGLAQAALLLPWVPRPVAWLVGLPFLVVAPGYAFVAVIVPETPAESTSLAPSRTQGAPGWLVRLALSLPISVLLVAAVALVLSFTVGIELAPAVIGVGAVTAGLALLALVRRGSLAPARRATPLGGTSGDLLGGAGFTPVQLGALALASLALVSAVALAGASPAGSESYSEFYVLAENETGHLVADDYPDEMVAGEGHPLYFAVENAEGESTTYDVIVRERPNGSGDAEVLDQFEAELAEGERVIVERTVAPTAVSEETRLEFLLYEDGVPETPRAENADVSLHLWVEVVPGDDG